MKHYREFWSFAWNLNENNVFFRRGLILLPSTHPPHRSGSMRSEWSSDCFGKALISTGRILGMAFPWLRFCPMSSITKISTIISSMFWSITSIPSTMSIFQISPSIWRNNHRLTSCCPMRMNKITPTSPNTLLVPAGSIRDYFFKLIISIFNHCINLDFFSSKM